MKSATFLSFLTFLVLLQQSATARQSASRIRDGEDPDPEIRLRRDFIRRMMKDAWDDYVRHAWGDNELSPVSQTGHTGSIFGTAKMGATIVDSLDTLYIMGL